MAIDFVKEFPFEYGVPDQVSPGIRRVIARNPGPFTYTGTGVYIVGTDEVAVIDPGPALPEHQEALDAALEGERVTAVLVTHHHLDHTPLAHPLAEKHGAKVYGRPAPVADNQMTKAKVEEGADAGFSPDVMLEEGQRIEGPGWTLEAIATPGHTSNHLCFAFAEEKACFTGDHIMGWSTTVVAPPDGDMADYMDSLRKIHARGFDTLWPTHGPPVRNPEQFIRAYLGHRLSRERQVKALLEQGYERAEDMVPMLYKAVDRRLWPAAAMSVQAHMDKLTRA